MTDPVPPFETIAVSHDGPLGGIVLQRPERHNAMSHQLLTELVTAATWLDARPDLKVVVIRGAGPSFCAGFDLTQLGAPADSGNGAALGLAMATAVSGLRAITIAAVHGHCVGGGVVLAAACDLRLAATSATFRIPEVDIGIPLFWDGVPLLVRELGPAVTKELVLTCRPVPAAEAKALGFVNRVVADGDLDAAVGELAAALAAKPRKALLTTKRQVDDAARGGGWGSAVVDDQLMASALADAEARDAARRYLSDRAAKSR